MQFMQKRKKKYCKSKVNMKHHPNGRLKNIIVFSTLAKYLCGTQDGAVARVPACHQCGAGANSGDDTNHVWDEFVFDSLPYPEWFSLVTPVFLCPQKPGMVHEEPLCVCGYATSKSLFIFIIIIKSFVVRMLDNFWYWRFRMQMLDSPVQLLVR